MTQFIYDLEKDSPDDSWTSNRLEEETFLNLCRTKERITNGDQMVTVSKYYRQAQEKMFRIAYSNPLNPLPFVINISDFSPKVKKELEDYLKETNDIALFGLLKQVIGKFFENLDYQYYHGSVMCNLKVRLTL